MTVGNRARGLRGALVVVLAVVALSGCSAGQTDARPSVVKKEIVHSVTLATSDIGGDWRVYRGPDVESCSDHDEEHVRYVYIVERPKSADDDVAADMRKLEGSWQRAGIAVERFSTKGENPTVGLRGFGGPVTSIGYVSYYGGYRITGASKCAPGDALDLSD
ncbi:hypothetical protein J2Y89_002304 [Curtobacterium herbarum]|uniref:hypothetical protein n=1 Tax=Curtobacterium TaxID=2034 RepID=UPI00209CE0EE|nr:MULTISPECIES: hypothetical protein [Curtobacterium]MCP1503560.1 hypothetical protein [Curtobacterium herbarum]MDN4646751.1 hypothetical protein [Curtobacterium sp. PsM8]